jgi:hypothetical protein
MLAVGVFFAVSGAAVLHAMSEHYGQAEFYDGLVKCEGYMVPDGWEPEPGHNRYVVVTMFDPQDNFLIWDGLADSYGHHLEVGIQHAPVGSGWYRCHVDYYEEIYPNDPEYDQEDYWVEVN